MSYHVAKILPSTQPLRRFVAAHDPWARQLRTIIPRETFPYNARNGRAIGNYAPLPWPLGSYVDTSLGDAGDGLGSTLVVI